MRLPDAHIYGTTEDGLHIKLPKTYMHFTDMTFENIPRFSIQVKEPISTFW